MHPTQASTKNQAFVLRLSIVSVEVGQLIFVGNFVLLYLIILYLVIVPDCDGIVQC